MEKHEDQLVHAVFGATELLMFDVDRVIIGMDLEKGSFAWLSKKMVLQDFQLTEDQFLDACCIAGFEFCGTFPALPTENFTFSFKTVHELLRTYRTGFNVVNLFATSPEVIQQNSIDIYCRTRSAIKFHPVMLDNGEVQPMHADQVPGYANFFVI